MKTLLIVGGTSHVEDPLGGFLTTEQLALRDWRVFAGLRERGVPVAWVPQVATRFLCRKWLASM